MMKQAITVALGLTMATGALAGTLDLNSQSYSSLFDTTTSSFVYQNPQSNSGSSTGAPISASAQTIAYSGFNNDESGAFNTLSASTTSETSGSFFLYDAMNIDAVTYGAVCDTQGSFAKYTFTTSTSTVLSLSFNTSITTDGSLTGGIGLWNYGLYVDGTQYPSTGTSSPPAASGSWLIPLFACTHEIDAYSNSNISIGPSAGSEQMYENVYFTAQATPEPAPFAMLGLGVVGLLVRRRNRR
jgi:hypothetical protein